MRNPRKETARHEALLKAVGRAFDDTDPVGLLALGCPRDEYSPEIGTILPRVCGAASAASVTRILHEELSRWFEPAAVGPPESLAPLAIRIWEAVQAFRREASYQ